MTAFRGLTWDHPRGYAALERAAAEDGNIIIWDRQPLEGFESAPIEEVAAGYDLVVLDHPHLGDALASGCLQTLDTLFPADVLADIDARTIGSCFQSYEMDGHAWALPLDAAAQVSAGRPDLLSRAFPETFDDLDRFASPESGFVMSLAGPHAFLSLLSLCASLNDCFGAPEDDYLLPQHDLAIELFVSLAKRSHVIGFTHNPIALLHAMAKGAVSYCPLVFGYVNYSRSEHAQPLAFRNAPSARPAHPPRAVLGGTGIAITQSCRPNTALLTHLANLLSVDVQNVLIAETGGQPSAESAWRSPAINSSVNEFYRQTLTTLQHAFVRPRHHGYVPSQSAASSWLRDNMAAPLSAAAVRSQINVFLRKALH